jgi:hypothetical protein
MAYATYSLRLSVFPNSCGSESHKSMIAWYPAFPISLRQLLRLLSHWEIFSSVCHLNPRKMDSQYSARYLYPSHRVKIQGIYPARWRRGRCPLYRWHRRGLVDSRPSSIEQGGNLYATYQCTPLCLERKGTASPGLIFCTVAC